MARWTIGDLVEELQAYDETSPVVIYDFHEQREYHFVIDDDTEKIRLGIVEP